MEYIIIVYFAVGVILSFMWWNDEYDADYELAKKNGTAESSMASLLLLMMAVFWPLKAIINVINGFKKQDSSVD